MSITGIHTHTRFVHESHEKCIYVPHYMCVYRVYMTRVRVKDTGCLTKDTDSGHGDTY